MTKHSPVWCILLLLFFCMPSIHCSSVSDAFIYSATSSSNIYLLAPVRFTIYTDTPNCANALVSIVYANDTSITIGTLSGPCDANGIVNSTTTLGLSINLDWNSNIWVALTEGTIDSATVNNWHSSKNFTITGPPRIADIIYYSMNTGRNQIYAGEIVHVSWSVYGDLHLFNVMFQDVQTQNYTMLNQSNALSLNFSADDLPLGHYGYLVIQWSEAPGIMNKTSTEFVVLPVSDPTATPSKEAIHQGHPKDAITGIAASIAVMVAGLLILGTIVFLIVRQRRKKRAYQISVIGLAAKPLSEENGSKNNIELQNQYDHISSLQPQHYGPLGSRNSVQNNSTGSSEESSIGMSVKAPYVPPSKRLSLVPGGPQWEINFEEIELQKEIGTGAYGRVYVGNWRQSKVAVKVLKTQLLSDKDIDEFESEAALMMRLRPHRNVVQLLGICTKPPNFCMVMEFLEGGSLASYIKTKSLSPPELIDIARGIAAGMYHLACEKIVHRDLAARNILMDRSGTPKVSDFGMSRVLMTTEEEGQTQSYVGPIKWMAPESIGSREYSEKSDVWSYGIVLWEISHRSPPHPNVPLLDAALKIRGGYTPEIGSGTPSLLRTIMEECWKFNPLDRPNFNDLCKWLSE